MKSLVAGTVLIAGLAVAVPAMAQGVYIGPGGVGVDSGYGHRYSRYDDDYGRRGYRDGYERRGYYEGRSVSPGYGHRNYFYDHY